MLQIIGTDKGGNVKAIIDGTNYTFATTEFYGGASVYGIAKDGDFAFTFIGRSKKAEKFYKQYSAEIENYLNSNK